MDRSIMHVPFSCPSCVKGFTGALMRVTVLTALHCPHCGHALDLARPEYKIQIQTVDA